MQELRSFETLINIYQLAGRDVSLDLNLQKKRGPEKLKPHTNEGFLVRLLRTVDGSF
jgi:hypothetical protein